MSLPNILVVSNALLLILFAASSLYRISKRSIETILVIGYMLLTAITDLLLVTLGHLHINNHAILNSFILLEFLSLGPLLFFWAGIGSIKKNVLLLLPFFLAGWINLIYTGISHINAWNNYLETYAFLLVSGFALIKHISGGDALTKNPRFWITSGALFYFVETVITFLLIDIFIVNKQNAVILHYSIIIGLIVRNTFFVIGLFKFRYRPS